MPESPRNSQLTLLSLAIIVAAVLIAGSVLLSRSSPQPSDELLQRITQTNQMLDARLNALEQPQIAAAPRPSTPSSTAQAVGSPQNPSPQTVATVPPNSKTFTWKEFEMSYPASLSLERTQTGWQLNGNPTSNINIKCPVAKWSQYDYWKLKLDTERSYTRTNGHAWDARLFSGPYKSPYEETEDAEQLLVVIQGAWDQPTGGKEGCEVTLQTDSSKSNRARYDTYELAKSLYQSIR